MLRTRDIAGGIGRRARRARWSVVESIGRVERRVGAGEVALTFDDGPHPDSTPRVLDRLGELGVVATFFCVGRNATAHPEIVRRALAEGHAVGSHSGTHPDPAELGIGPLAGEYRDGRAAVTAVVGREVPLFRPPHGHLTPRSAAMVRRQSLRPWLWTVDPTDWRPGVTAAEVAAVATSAVSGDVVLMHDWVEQPWAPEALDRSATIEALPAVVRSARDRGLVFTTLPAR
ncbi:polysaccharide deacetylase family protein [Modestobacter sp. VKM Ac-2986]|uniref:polysaccharide deacetylase family protein n=1 Tax=Modestobacter sp. VKM Ac-2986 TaxID=3004140 RepID=UPI0022ABA8A5|nr:polysaccharide deacetylase family protein [Modestobacter sp. VKM Ac-2986]MCZ2830866.1 polysaccharide deacetylase family protein [Modestobacter sp. VKM Ac-2986]